jgi:hypothetical protein
MASFRLFAGSEFKPGYGYCQRDLGVLGNHPAVKDMPLAARAFTSARKKVHSMCWRSQPVQHMTTQRVAFGTRRVIEILARVATHTEPVHKAPGTPIGGNGVGNDLVQAEPSETVIDHSLCRFQRHSPGPNRDVRASSPFRPRV